MFEFHDLGAGDHRWTEAFPVLAELRPHLTLDTFRAVAKEAEPEGLRFTVCFEPGGPVGVAGWRVMTTTYSDRKLHIDDLVVARSHRGHGVGSALLSHLRGRAVELRCTAIDLDSRVHRHDAHRFYLRERYDISAHHFLLELGHQPSE
ncbi:acetyltransferase (GNAT) family protein [Kribbella sp. VKM Ac-2571]|nr:acetyltransferase (GNAT) family protein [Kribbella sp. VKM Ac-2571]